MATTPTTPQTTRIRPGASVPLAIWPVAQRTAQYQRAGRYHPDCRDHPGKMVPELARRIVAEYSAPGALVVDPMAGVGTTLVEAALLGRRAIGVELEQRWLDLAASNAAFVLGTDADRLVEVHHGNAARLVDLLGADAGRVDLICTSPPYACDVGNVDKANWDRGGGLCPSRTRNYSVDRANLGHLRGDTYEAAMAEIYAACYAALRPGGLLVTVTKNTRRKGRTLDLAGLTVALAQRVGFTYLAHVIALRAAVRDSNLVGRASFWQLTQTRKARARGEPAHHVVHEDVEVLSKGTPQLTTHALEVSDAR